MSKMYLGDSVYAAFDGHGFILTTENGLPYDPSNKIYLELEVLEVFNMFVERCLRGEGE